jgi:hypothetical protein
MKLKRISIEGFRGAPVPVELRLAEKSLCLLAENGRGKTTIVDGLELWSSADIRHYHREGYDLACVVNLDSSVASVTCETTEHPPLTRTLAAGVTSQFQPARPMAVGTTLPSPLPILRHRTMAEFMDMSPGEKKKTLLEFFGLAALTDFRQTLRTASTTAERAAKQARRAFQGEARALETLRAGREVVELAEELRGDARLSQAITSEENLLDLELEQLPAKAEPDRPSLVAALAKAVEEAEDDATAAWNEAVSKREVLIARSLSALVNAGERVLDDWEEATCPLCRQPKDRDELLQELRERAVQLREADDRFNLLERELADYRSRLSSLVSALDAVIRAAPERGWPESAKLHEARDRVQAHLASLATARSERKVCESSPVLDLPSFADLEAAARGSAHDERAPLALARLVRLQEQVRRINHAKRSAAAATSVSKAMDAFLEASDAGIRRAIEETIGRVGVLAADYYGRLVSTPVYSDVKLKYTTGRSGGVEFSLVFDNRHPVTPPQRVMSESQSNALGLALFLARLKVDPLTWPWSSTTSSTPSTLITAVV